MASRSSMSSSSSLELAELVGVLDLTSGVGLCVSATRSLIVISPSSLPELRRRVVGLHRLADDLAASSASPSCAPPARRSSAAGRAVFELADGLILSLVIISIMYAGTWIGCTLLIRARLIACLIHQLA